MNIAVKPFKPEHYINRELSWLAFNQRVLQQALDTRTPLLERVKFYCISSSNLDEFFEVRVAGLKQQVESGNTELSADGRTPAQTLAAVNLAVRRMVTAQSRCWGRELRPALARHGIRFLRVAELSDSDLAWLDAFYHKEVRPVLTPMAIDPAHPFPQILNRSLNIIVRVLSTAKGQRHRHLAVVQVPRVLPRLVSLPRAASKPRDYIFLAHVIGHFLGDLFPGTEIEGFWPFRLTRNSELYIDEEDSPNLLKSVETELHNRRRGAAVRLEVERDCPQSVRAALLGTFNLSRDDLFIINGPLNPTRLLGILEGSHSPTLRDRPFVPRPSPLLRGKTDIFGAIRERDVLLHHPYETFESVVEFVEKAAIDPAVLAIKLTLYRIGGDRRLVTALINAARNGKQVTAVVELRARFDEANNISWARQLEEAGVNVVYGLVGFKIDAKVCLIVRREDAEIRRYVHLGTGNYNPTTARLYTDLSYFTCRADCGEDVTNLFNLLTGICQFQTMRKLLVAPFDMHSRLLQMIETEIENARRGRPARIVAKMNSLVERTVIEALYRASQAGVRIELIVRGICCLRPGIPGISSNIRVRSIVDHFLEHSRIWCFQNGADPKVFLTSADWMPRNLLRRVEIAFPVEDPLAAGRIADEILALQLQDNANAYTLRPDGTYRRCTAGRGARRRRSQMEFIAKAETTAVVNGSPEPGEFPTVRVSRRPKTLSSGPAV